MRHDLKAEAPTKPHALTTQDYIDIPQLIARYAGWHRDLGHGKRLLTYNRVQPAASKGGTMPRHLVTLVLVTAVTGSALLSAQGRVKQHGRAIVEYRSDDVLALASYEYSQRHHDGAWLLIEFAVQAT